MGATVALRGRQNVSVIVTCRCGKRVKAPQSWAGRRGKCSYCGQTVFVPLRNGTELIIWSGTDFQLLEWALHQELPQLAIQPAANILGEAEKWAKVWKLPVEHKSHHAGFALICDLVSSCVMRDAAVGMDMAMVSRTEGEPIIRVAVKRGERTLLHFVARSGEDEYLCWHHRDAEDEEIENAREQTDVLQAQPGGVHCSNCEYNIAYTQVSKDGQSTTVEYRRGHFCWRRGWCHKEKGNPGPLVAFRRDDDAIPPKKL